MSPFSCGEQLLSGCLELPLHGARRLLPILPAEHDGFLHEVRERGVRDDGTEKHVPWPLAA